MNEKRWDTQSVLAVVNELIDETLRDSGRLTCTGQINFFRRGGTSLEAVRLIARLKAMGLVLTVREFFTNPTADGATHYILGRLKNAGLQVES